MKQTNLNKRRFPINFEILLVQNYNLKIPIILCKTNFTFPSLFDNRNLFNCLSNHWNVKNNDDIIYMWDSVDSISPVGYLKVDIERINEFNNNLEGNGGTQSF